VIVTALIGFVLIPRPPVGQVPAPSSADGALTRTTLPKKRGKQPCSPDMILRRSIRPAAKPAGINKDIGWHTFRRTFSTLLKANGEEVMVVQELMRHASARITLDVCAQAATLDKRNARSKIAGMLLEKIEAKKAA
jgi:integrase